MLKVESVNYAYQDSFQLTDISFELNTGDVLGVIGESGCGKTTLLKLLFGKLDANKGKLLWHNEKILGPSHQLIAGHEDFKYVTQDFELMPYITVLENIIKPLSRQHLDESTKRAKELVRLVNLENQEQRKVKNLSGGQKQRVALAQALAKKPKLLLLDEPFSHIDSFFKNELRRNLFRFIKKEQITCIIATHDNADVLPFADKIMVLKNGKKLDYKTPEQLYNNPGSPYVAGLFGDYNLINSNLIPAEQTKKQTVIYPHELEIVVSSKNDIEIMSHYFMGDYYKIIIKYDDQILIVHSLELPDFKLSYTIKFKKDLILKRLRD